MFFFYIIFIILFILSIVTSFTTIQIHIQNFRFSTDKKDGKFLNKNYKIIVKLYLFEKIKFLQFNLTQRKIERKEMQEKISQIEQKMMVDKNNFDIKLLKELKHLNLKLKKIHLKVDIGLEDAAAGAISVGIASGFIAILFGKFMDKKSEIFWKVIPIYQNRNLCNVNLDCIFSLKLIHIIYTIYVLRKKGVKNNGTSNRRTYAYSHE